MLNRKELFHRDLNEENVPAESQGHTNNTEQNTDTNSPTNPRSRMTNFHPSGSSDGQLDADNTEAVAKL